MTIREREKIVRRRKGYRILYNQPLFWSALVAIICLLFTLSGRIFCMYSKYANGNELPIETERYISMIMLSCKNLYFGFVVASIVFITVWFLSPVDKLEAQDSFQSIALRNSLEEVPKLLRKKTHMGSSQQIEFHFYNPSIPLSEWQSKQEYLETAFNINIISIAYGHSKRKVVICAIPSTSLPDFVEWRNEYLSKEDYILTLGEGYGGLVTVDLRATPHLMVAAATGGGKTQLVKLLLFQLIKHNASIIICDLKKGVDFPLAWHNRCTMCFDEQSLLEQLNFLVTTLEKRQAILRASDCRNLEEYNKKTKHPLPRFILAVDEVAELLDKTGLAKSKRDLVDQIADRLSRIARLGRASGVHLFLSTQRPSADIIPGQIRSNLGFKACGRADSNLAQIVDCPTAAQIPKNVQGRFTLPDGSFFQAYWFDDSKL